MVLPQMPNVKARGAHPYLPARGPVPDNKVSWDEPFSDYEPTEFTHPTVIANNRLVKENGWADPSNHKLIQDELRQLFSYEGKLDFDEEGRPINPCGRTGMTGQGLLGKWGANQAADPIVTRMNEDGRMEVVVIRRMDTGQWALPGGMVDKGETVSATVRREFEEEAGAFDDPATQAEFRRMCDKLFSNGVVVYRGYVDDPRNTDNAWMETSVYHFHCSDWLGEMLPLKAGDDAVGVQWKEIDPGMDLYGDHKRLLQMAFPHLMLPTARPVQSFFERIFSASSSKTMVASATIAAMAAVVWWYFVFWCYFVCK